MLQRYKLEKKYLIEMSKVIDLYDQYEIWAHPSCNEQSYGRNEHSDFNIGPHFHIINRDLQYDIAVEIDTLEIISARSYFKGNRIFGLDWSDINRSIRKRLKEYLYSPKSFVLAINENGKHREEIIKDIGYRIIGYYWNKDNSKSKDKINIMDLKQETIENIPG